MHDPPYLKCPSWCSWQSGESRDQEVLGSKPVVVVFTAQLAGEARQLGEWVKTGAGWGWGWGDLE